MSSDLIVHNGGGAVVTREYLHERRAMIREQLAPGASDAELELLIEVSTARGLNPITRQIYGVMRWDSKKRKEVMAIQTGIDGFRLIAQRTGDYRGQVGPEWCGPDGQWRDVWLESTPPAAARVGVLRAGWTEPLYGVARWNSYVQTNKDGAPVRMWAQMPDVMLAKVAEALALRKAFPEDLSGLYTGDEMAQADAPSPTATVGEPQSAPAEPDPARELELARARELLAMADGDGDLVKATLAEHSIARADLVDDGVWQAARAAVEAAMGEPGGPADATEAAA